MGNETALGIMENVMGIFGPNAVWVIFLCVYFALAAGYVPFFGLDRTGAVFIGALLIIGFHLLSLKEAFEAMEYKTLFLLFNMMTIVSFFINSGVLSFSFTFLERVKSPQKFLWITIGLSGLSSALFINDIVCLVLTPIISDIALMRKWHPVPYLLAVAMASNIGSAMTPVGNPQNMFISSVSGIAFPDFVFRILPLSALGLLLLGIILSFMLRGENDHLEALPGSHVHHVRKRDVVRSAAVLTAVLAGFLAGMEAGVITGIGAAFLLLTRNIPRKKVFALVDWDLLVLFASLFVVMAATEKFGIISRVFDVLKPFGLETTVGFSLITLILSNIIGNVPAVVFLSPIVGKLGGGETRYLLLAAISTFAGNLTLVGSIANLIVAEKAKAKGITIDFQTYARNGFLITLVLCAAAAAYFSVIRK